MKIIFGKPIEYSFVNLNDPFLVRFFCKVSNFCLTSKIFSLITFGHFHTLAHELGHAVAFEILARGEATITLSTKSLYGSTFFCGPKRDLSPLEATFVDLAGPLSNVAFSVASFVSILAIPHSIPLSCGLNLALRVTFGSSSLFWILGEFLYGGVSAVRGDNGDFGNIKKRGWSHLVLSTTVLVGVCALGALKATTLL